MNTAVLPFGMGDLVRQCAGAVALVSPHSLALALRFAPGAALDLFSGHVVGRVDALARRLSASALSMEALLERIDSTPSAGAPLDPDDGLYRLLRDLETNMREASATVRREWVGLDVPASGRRAMIAAAVVRMVASLDMVAETARDLRGAIQAHDANVDAILRASRASGRAATVPQELDAQLDDVFRR